MRVLVLGLGNPLLGDDGVGWKIAEQCATHFRNASHIEVDYHAGGGLSLMERMIGYDCAIIVDAITTGEKPTGTVSCFRLNDLPPHTASHLASSHETTLQTALQVGRALKVALPSAIIVVAVEARAVYDFSEKLSPAVASAVPLAVRFVQQAIRKEGVSA